MSGKPIVRLATRADLPAIVQLLADDNLGGGREDTRGPLNEKYVAAFYTKSR